LALARIGGVVHDVDSRLPSPTCPKTRMGNPARAAMSRMPAATRRSAPRGTVTSSLSLSGATRNEAWLSMVRTAHSSSWPAWSRAVCTKRGDLPARTRARRSRSAATAARSRPGTPEAPPGGPGQGRGVSAATRRGRSCPRIHGRRKASRPGTHLRRRPGRVGVGVGAQPVAVASAGGRSLTVISVKAPGASEPTKSRVRSRPARSCGSGRR
jgi:hypothetical protein